MQHWRTLLVVGAVATIAVLAAADALRGGGEDEPITRSVAAATTTAPTPTTPSGTLPDTLRRAAVTGFAVYSDTACRLHQLVLPSLAEFVIRSEGTNDPVRRCSFTMGAGRLLAEGELISPDRAQIARCRRGHVEVMAASSGEMQSRVPGCAPAWRPDGGLTYARGARVLLGGRIVLLSKADLFAAARRLPNVAELGTDVEVRIRVTALAWLDNEHLVVSLEIRVPYMGVQPLAVLFRGKAVVAVATGFGRRVGNWVVSSAGSFAAAADGTVIARDGDTVEPPASLPDGRAVAFSPDEQWLVYVTGVSAYLIGTPRNSEPARIIRLPLPAQDFDWEPVTRG